MADLGRPAGDDHVIGARWTLHPAVRQALVVQSAREALDAGDATGALGMAEDLLDSDPDDLDALLLVAAAAPRCGHASVGILAAHQARRRGGDPGPHEAEALYAAHRLPEALLAAEAAVVRHPRVAAAHAIQARTLWLIGQPREAALSFARAHALAPREYPSSPVVPEGEWESLLLEALSALPRAERSRARALPIRFEDLPDLDELRAATRPFPALPPSVDGLLIRLDGAVTLKLYRKNLVFGCGTTAEIVERMRVVLEMELGGEGFEGTAGSAKGRER